VAPDPGQFQGESFERTKECYGGREEEQVEPPQCPIEIKIYLRGSYFHDDFQQGFQVFWSKKEEE